MSEGTVFHTAEKIINARGKIERVNPILWGKVYEDEKLAIQAILPVDYISTPGYTHMIIAINLPPENSVQQPAFEIPKTAPNRTTVYYWQGRPLFYRPGRWTYYLIDLAEEIRVAVAASQKLNKQPVDDTELFPDNPSGPRHYRD